MNIRFSIAILTLKKWFKVLSSESASELRDYEDSYGSVSQKEVTKAFDVFDAIDLDCEWTKLQNTIDVPTKAKKPKVIALLKPFLKYAAVLAGILLVGYYVSFHKEADVNRTPVISKNLSEELRLVVGNKVQYLTDEGVIITDVNGGALAKFENGELTYVSNAPYSTQELYIPYGKTLRVRLSDGTKIHCDSGTLLTYNSQFGSVNTREVFVKGQAFFDVSKREAQKFIVHAKELDITVLGTQFNVSSYLDDIVTSTVLLEGSIALTANDNQKPALLVPGQRAVYNKNKKKITVNNNVNTYDHTAWISDKMVFKRATFEEILKTISRRNNVTIINQNKTLAKQTFTATFDVESTEQILAIFQEYTPFTYTKTKQGIIINEQ